MSRIGVSVELTGADGNDIIASELKLFLIDDQSASNSASVALMLGLPVELCNEEFEQFIEPFLPAINGYTTVVEVVNPLVHSLCNYPQDLLQYKKSILISFESESSKSAFVALYNNIQIPVYSEVAPCLVVGVDRVEIDTKYYKQREGEGELKDKDASVIHNMAQCNFTDNNWGSAGGDVRSSSEDRVQCLSEAVHQLPTCVVCLRRLSTVGHYIPGAGDLRICRSYIYDNNIAQVRRIHGASGQQQQQQLQLQFSAKPPSVARGSLASSSATSPAKGRSPLSHTVTAGAEAFSSDSSSGSHDFSDCLRCAVCYIYSSITEHKYSGVHHFAPVPAPPTSSSSLSLSLSLSPSRQQQRMAGDFCMDCGLTDNIWLCMLCTYAGCGRYKAQHAHQHYKQSGHSLSLELASGRVWDYQSDTFLHQDQDDASSIIATGGISGGYGLYQAGEGDRGGGAHGEFLKGAGVSFSGVVGGQQDLSRLLDPGTVDKMGGIVRGYEALLQAQLADQQLHYEKLIARETVRALELTYRNNASAAAAGKTSSASSASSAALVSKVPASSGVSRCGLEEGEAAADGAVGGGEGEGDEELESQIEAAKLEISSLEAECRAVLDRVKVVEDEVRLRRKQNDALIKNQKALREKEAELLLKEEEVRQRCAATVADMEQQIRDLTFYARTRKEVQVSPLKDELMEANVVIKQSSSSSSTTQQQQSGGDSGRKDGKGYRKYKK